jgi:hypothetical protein
MGPSSTSESYPLSYKNNFILSSERKKEGKTERKRERVAKVYQWRIHLLLAGLLKNIFKLVYLHFNAK